MGGRASVGIEHSRAIRREILLLEQLPCPVGLLDFRTRTFIAASELLISQYGYDRKELMAMRLTDFFLPEDQPGVIEAVEQLARDIEPARITITLALKQRKKDGTFIEVDAALRKISLLGKDFLFLHSQDVTERRKTQEALQASETNYRLIVDNIHEVIYRIEAGDDLSRSKVQFVSPAARKILGYDPAEFLQDPGLWARMVHPDDLSAVAEATQRIHRERTAGIRQYRFRHKTTGEYRWIEDRVTPLEDQNGRVVALQGAAQDITQQIRSWQEKNELLAREQKARARAETARDRMKVLSKKLVEAQETERRRLARELHDEVGQLLTLLMLTLEPSLRSFSEQSKASLRDAQNAVRNILSVVRNLSLELRPSMLDDLGLLPAILWLFDRFTTKTQTRVAFWHEGIDGRRFPAAVETAAYRIVQEALTNVARHAGVSDVCVNVRAIEDILQLQIEDLGCGFDSSAVLTSSEYTGLQGMSERAESVGGRFSIESVRNKGTRIFAQLPASPTTAGKDLDHERNHHCAR